MARCKSSPEIVRTKCELALRLKEVRIEQYGDRGGPELARRLNLPIRTWYNYETGVTVPSEVLLRFIELTNVDPSWLLHGTGAKYRPNRPAPGPDGQAAGQGTVHDLLRKALALLEEGPASGTVPEVILPKATGIDPEADQVVVQVVGAEAGDDDPADPESIPLKRDWLVGGRRFHCVRIRGDAMAPVLADGAVVGIADRPEEPDRLNGALVAAQVGGRLVVRWLQVAGQVVLLRAEDPAFEPEVVPIDGDGGDDDAPPLFRRVLWSCTPQGSVPLHRVS